MGDEVKSRGEPFAVGSRVRAAASAALEEEIKKLVRVGTWKNKQATTARLFFS
jgi:hypothetical protein